jgi:PAS domain S-box-containing protein
MSRVALVLCDEELGRQIRRGLGDDYDVVDVPADAEALAMSHHDVAIVDVATLDGAAGVLATARTRGDVPPPPVLIVAPRARTEDAARHLGCVGDELLIEPVNRVELRARLRTLLGTRHRLLVLHTRRSEQWLRFALDATGTGAWSWDTTTRRLAWTEGFARILGVPADTQAVQTLLSGIHPGDVGWAGRALQHALDTGVGLDVRFRTAPAAGGARVVAMKGEAIRDADGRVVRLIGVATDVTEQTRAVHAARRRERQLAALTELTAAALTSPDLAAVFDTVAVIVARTLDVPVAGVAALLPGGHALRLQAAVGLDAADVGRAVIDAAPGSQAAHALATSSVVVEDLETDPRFRPAPILRQRGIVSGITATVRGTGRPFGVIGAFATDRRTFSSEDVRFMTSVADTLAQAVERRTADDRLRIVLSQLPAVVWVTDTALCITGYGGSGLAAFDATPSQYLGRSLQDMVAPDSPGLAAHRQALAKGRPVSWRERWNGRVIDGYAEPLRDRTGNVIGVVGGAHDVTAQAEAEDVRRRAEERLRALLESSYDAIVVVDRDGHPTYAAGRSAASEEERRHWRERIHPDDRAAAEAALAEALAEPRKPVRSLVRMRADDGSWRWFESTTRNLLDHPAVGGLVINSHDVTAERAADEALREHAVLLDRAHAVVTDLEGIITAWHGGAERLYGWPRDAAIGRRAENLLETSFPEPCETIVAAVLRDGAWEGELEQTTRDGHRITVASHWAVHRDAEGTARAILQVSNDITAQKRIEAQLRLHAAELRELAGIIEQAHVFVRDAADRIVFWSAGAERLYGIPRSDALGRVFHELLGTVFPEPLDAVHARLVREGRWDGELVHRLADGRSLVVGSSWVGHRDTTGRIRAVMQVDYDLTELRRVEADLARSHAALSALNARQQAVLEEERARIAREIHDDLGQMLTGIKMDLSWIGTRLARSRSAVVRELAGKVDGMLRLVDEAVHSVRRIATDLRPAVLDDLGLPAAIEWQARQFSERVGIPCAVDLALAADAVDGDTGLTLFRIVQESLTNVARHAAARLVTITVRRVGDDIVVEVADDGRGMTEAERTGPRSVGLLGMRERARLAAGELRIEGGPGRGTTVVARVPARRPA